MVHIGNSWDQILGEEFKKPYYLNLREFLKKEYARYKVYPDMYHIFNALKYTPYESVKAVIIGQDPYHEPGQAHGLCFSVQKGTPLPPSLQNIYKELHDDLGVLLLNTSLTVRQGQANSHSGKGWELLTDEIIRKLNNAPQPIAFILWGSNARSKAQLITNPNHGIFQAPHPSPLSAYRGFFGCRHFSKVNSFLSQKGVEPIDWTVRDI